MLKILVAEDEPVARDFLEFILRQEGFQPILAEDGDVALIRAQQDKPDLILLDAMMPFVDGFEVLRRLKESDELKHIPVIMLTARTSDTDFSIGFDIGAADYVEKPFSIVKLVTRIHKVLRDAGLESPPAGPVSS
jgi:DNA-binding response OmpR family regulator